MATLKELFEKHGPGVICSSEGRDTWVFVIDRVDGNNAYGNTVYDSGQGMQRLYPNYGNNAEGYEAVHDDTWEQVGALNKVVPTGYVKDALRTAPINETLVATRAGLNLDLLHAGMGLATESGEFLDAIKKAVFYGKPIDHPNLIEELGDIMWYCAIAANYLGVSFEYIQKVNIDKLKARFPDRFTEENAINRDLDAERKVLEGQS